jgi:acid phosphatase (class A)
MKDRATYLGSGSTRPRRATGRILLLSLLLGLLVPSLAPGQYIATNQLNGLALLAPPPAAGSPEEAADLATVRAVFKGRTADEEARAKKDATLSIFLYAPAIGPFFEAGKFPKTEALFMTLKTNLSIPINAVKDHYKRKRPYELDPKLMCGRPETSFGYPSGHSTRGTVQALVLAELFPDKREALLGIGRQIGWDRVLIGKHFPTDIYAGRVLAQAIVRELLISPAFQRDLAAARAELQAAQSPAKPTQ